MFCDVHKTQPIQSDSLSSLLLFQDEVTTKRNDNEFNDILMKCPNTFQFHDSWLERLTKTKNSKYIHFSFIYIHNRGRFILGEGKLMHALLHNNLTITFML